MTVRMRVIWGVAGLMACVAACGDEAPRSVLDAAAGGSGGGPLDGGGATSDAAAGSGGGGSGGSVARDAAVGGDAGVDAGGGGAVAGVAEVPGRIAAAICEAIEQCRGAQLTRHIYLGHECLERNVGALQDGALYGLAEAVAAGRVVLHAASAQVCTDAIAALGCDVLSRRRPLACEAWLEATVPLGGQCDASVECVGGAYCHHEPAGSCPGVCSAPLGVDASCNGSWQCKDGLMCGGAPGDSTCGPPPREGDSCSSVFPECDVAFACANVGGRTACQPLATLYDGALGEPCGAPGDLCDPGLVCASMTPTTGTCEEPVGAGQPCRRAMPNQCLAEQYCDANLGEVGMCKDLPRIGQPCLAMRAQVCAPGSVCILGTCEGMKRPGEPCAGRGHCYVGVCGELGAGNVCPQFEGCGP